MTQILPKAFIYGITPDGLYGTIGFSGLIVFASTGGVSQINPVSGLVTGAFKQGFIDKRLKIINGMMVLLLPIL
jgi:hypothetical protein